MGPIGQESQIVDTMPKTLTILLLAFFLCGPAWAQQNASGSEAEEPEIGEPEQTDEADDTVDPDFDDSDLDEQTYEEDDDDFVPSEEIPADEPIAFPSNI